MGKLTILSEVWGRGYLHGMRTLKVLKHIRKTPPGMTPIIAPRLLLVGPSPAFANDFDDDWLGIEVDDPACTFAHVLPPIFV